MPDVEDHDEPVEEEGAEAARVRAAFGTVLRVFRARAGLHVAELARNARVSRRHLSQVEAGEKDPGLVWQRKVARALGVRLAALHAALDDELGDEHPGR
ncbi:MAG TPA: helix-turn-helix domain-containing protein [Myxococcaceae bacterium]|nr:helix-turn-helix domain-containing protein [Myxococcaceae bacterium]